MERARIADAFFGPDAESTDGEKSLTRRIQVVSDLAVLYEMRHRMRRYARIDSLRRHMLRIHLN